MNVVLDDKTGCLLWQGARDDDGYGVVRTPRGTQRAHRWAWEAVYGPLEKGAVLLHQCDTPACINVGHLKKGTQRDNLKDRDAKGRQARGEKNGAAKLSNADRLAIAESWKTSEALAAIWRVDRATIDAIRGKAKGERWSGTS